MENRKKHVCIGLVAHVDAGKTTLSEALLYQTGQIRSLGRVDHQDAFLDNDSQERERGITIFSNRCGITRRCICCWNPASRAAAFRRPLPAAPICWTQTGSG